jgi:mannose/cellobiose epimerase-like protein (N-acyl-D-glucosamine 2-epimerase family)
VTKASARAALPARRVRDWIETAGLPLWLSQGLDPVHGGFEEALSLSGARIPGLSKRVRVQARQIYVMSHAALIGFAKDKALAAAHSGYDFLMAHAPHPEGGFVHLLKPDGAVENGMRDAYDHAFILMALGWFYRATGESGALDWVERILGFLDEHMIEADGAILESLPPQGPEPAPRRQNPHMHLFEAMLSLYEATADRRFLERAGRLFALFKARFFDAGQGILREFFDESWQPVPGPAGEIVEPGHHAEWVWLLDKYERLTGEDTGPDRKALIGFALAHGRDPASGLLIDEVARDGRVLRPTMRCWPQTEGLKAALVSLERGEAWAGPEAVRFAEGLLGRYLAVEPAGLWQDQFDPAGAGLAKTAPASTLYHVFLAFAELLRVSEGLSTPGTA